MPFAPALLVNGDPVLSGELSAVIPENTITGFRFARLAAVDATGGVSFELIDDADGRFFLSGDGLRLTEGAVLDTNAAGGSYSVVVRMTDAAGQSVDTTILIGVSDTDTIFVSPEGSDGPDDLAGAPGLSTLFAATPGDDVYDLGFGGAVFYAGNRSDYAVSFTPASGGGYGGYGGYGSGDPTPAQLQIADTRAGGPDGVDLIINPNYVIFADGGYTVSELTTNGATGLTFDGRKLDLDGYIAENIPVGTVVGTLGMRGLPGEVPTVTSFAVFAYYGPGAFDFDRIDDLFSMDASGNLVTNAAIDYERYKQFFVSVSYVDTLGNADTDSLNFMVDDVPELPHQVRLFNAASVGEHSNRDGDVSVGEILIFDQDDPVDGYQITLTGPGSERFYLVGNEVFLRQGAVIDFESEPVVSIGVSIIDSGLILETTVSFDVGFQILGGTHLADALDGNDVVDVIAAFAGADDIDGLGGDDVLFGGSGRDTLNGGEGDDVINGDFGADVLNGDAGDDVLAGGTDGDTLFGGDGSDHLYGGAQPGEADYAAFRWTSVGSAGTPIGDTFAATVGSIAVNGSITNNGALVSKEIASALMYLEPGEPFSQTSGLILTGLEPDIADVNLAFTDAATGAPIEVDGIRFRLNDVDSGSFLDQLTVQAFDATGTEVAVTLTPAGDDIVIGQTVFGGAGGGNDSSEADGSVLVNVAGPAQSILINYSNGLVVQQLVLISDIAFASAEANGDDTLVGGAGDDELVGGAGNDIAVFSGNFADYAFSLSSDLLTVSDLRPVTGNDGTDTVSGVELFRFADGDRLLADLFATPPIEGTPDADTLEGTSAADIVIGLDGNDLLFGFGDNDTLYGGDGDDSIGGQEGNDMLFGGAGSDTMSGGLGDDLLDGGAGQDTLVGGTGADVFRFSVSDGTHDRVKGFELGVDAIEISVAAFGALSDYGLGPLDPLELAFGTRATTADQHLIYNQSKGHLLYDVDGVDGQAAVIIAALTNKPSLAAEDIILI